MEHIYGINSIEEIDFRKWNDILFLDAASNHNIKKELDANYNLQNEYKFYEIFDVFEYKSDQR